MSSLTKIILGALVTALLAWILHGPMGWGKDCVAAAGAGAPAVVDAPAGNLTVAPATAEAVTKCQDGVNALLTGKAITFESGSASISAASTPLVDEIAAALKGCEGTTIEVAGHTDAAGSDAINMRVSEARANAVVESLVAKGIAGNRLVAKGYGESQPVDPNDAAKNRRIEFKLAAAAAPAPEGAK